MAAVIGVNKPFRRAVPNLTYTTARLVRGDGSPVGELLMWNDGVQAIRLLDGTQHNIPNRSYCENRLATRIHS